MKSEVFARPARSGSGDGQGRAPERVIRVTSVDPGRRLDSWLRSHYAHVPRGLAQKLIRRGYVRINGAKARPDYRLQDGDRVDLPLSFERASSVVDRTTNAGLCGRGSGRRSDPPPELIESLRDSVLFEDEHYLCLSKPAGLCVHTGSGVRFDLKTLFASVWPQHQSLELAHRLDKETSGCLVLAKHWQALQSFHRLLRERRVEKEYTAVLHLPRDYPQIRASSGSLDRQSPDTGAVDRAPVAKARIIQIPLGRDSDKPLEASTEIAPLRLLTNAALVRVKITTGRHHQIRRHVAAVRQPVVGDRRYGLSARLERALGLVSRRLLLHAHRIAFSGTREYRFTAPLPADMDRWIHEH